MSKSNSLTRREFFGRAAAAGAAAAACPYVLTSSALGASGTPPASDQVTLGIIGTGGRSGAFINQTPILGVCDVDADRLERARQRVEAKTKGVTAYRDFRDLLVRDDIDAVVITSPDHWHCQISAMAAKAGKDVYCEKPLSSYIAESRALSDLIARRGTIFQTGSQQRSGGNFRFACELVRNGYIGEIKKITVGIKPGKATTDKPPEPIPEGFDYDMWLGPAPWVPYYKERCHYNFRFQLDYAAGKLSDWGAHHLDIAQWGIGTDHSGPVEIEGKGEFPAAGIFDAALHFKFTCTYPNGLKLYCSDTDPLGIRFDGSEGTVFVNRRGLTTEPDSLRSVKLSHTDVHLYRSFNHWSNFINCVRSRKEPAAPVEVAHRTVSICHLANVAMLLRRKVRWDPAREVFPDDDAANRMRMIRRSRREPWSF